MRFVETPIFTKIITRLDDEEYRSLQIALMLRPEQGPIIRGAGGLRKMRCAKPGSGKRGRLLTPTQARLLGQLVREEFK